MTVFIAHTTVDAHLGATLVEDHRGIRGPGSGWATLADPEGNLFCVLRSPAELSEEAQG